MELGLGLFDFGCDAGGNGNVSVSSVTAFEFESCDRSLIEGKNHGTIFIRYQDRVRFGTGGESMSMYRNPIRCRRAARPLGVPDGWDGIDYKL